MTGLALGTLLACAAHDARSALPPHQVFPSSEEALRAVLAEKPRVLGIGEVHASEGDPPGPTTLARFTSRLLPVLAPATTDLVIETWHLDGTCGAPAEAAVAQVQEDTRRPDETKSELTRLVEAAQKQGVRPHDLDIDCAEYATFTEPGGRVSYDALLKLLAEKLGDYARRGVESPDATVVLYGGAVHNDRRPSAAVAAYSYGAAAAARGGYVELDLYAPELVRGNDLLVEPSWAPLLDVTGPGRAILYLREPGSWVLLMEEDGKTPRARPLGSPASRPE